MENNNWIVMKFGGTSVSTRKSWQTIGDILQKRIQHGHRVLLVCSAVAGMTNALEQLLVEAVHGDFKPVLEEIKTGYHRLAEELGLAGTLLENDFQELYRLVLGVSLVGELTTRQEARILSYGEVMATRLGAAFLKKQDLVAAWKDAREILTAKSGGYDNLERCYLSANCHYQYEPSLSDELGKDGVQVVVTQGFIAKNSEGHTVLLGRGGSDTSAAYMATRLGAVRCEIWTDVPGIYTATPQQIPSARLLKLLDFDEAQEIISTGAKVLHPRCLTPLQKYGIPLYIRCTQRPEIKGTVISPGAPGGGKEIKAVSAKKGVMLITMESVNMWQQVGFLADTFGCFKQHGLSVDLVSTSETNVTVSLDAAANMLEGKVVEKLLADLSNFCQARSLGPCAMISLVGRNIRSVLHKLSPALEVFQEQKIYLVSQAANDLNLTFVVDEDQSDRLVLQLHNLFFSDDREDNIFGASWRQLFGVEEGDKQDEKKDDTATMGQRWWQDRRQELLQMAAQESPLYVYDQNTLNNSAQQLLGLNSIDRVFYAVKANAHPAIVKNLFQLGFGFECVSPGEIEYLQKILPDLAPQRILFTPNFAPASEYETAYERGVYVTMDNLYPLESWPQLFKGRELFLRLDPGQGRGHHQYVHTAGKQSKFGIAPYQIEKLLALLDKCQATVIGLHAHTGSGILAPHAWQETALFLKSMAENFPKLRFVDLGGGLGVVEKPGQTPLNLPEVDKKLAMVKETMPGIEFWLEPGRFLVAEAGVLLARVTQIKQKEEFNYVGINCGMNVLIRPMLYGSYHEIVNLTRLDDEKSMKANIVGPICESGDTLGYGRRLAPAQEGDIILIDTAGAYGSVMSSSYNMRKPASEAVLS